MYVCVRVHARAYCQQLLHNLIYLVAVMVMVMIVAAVQ